jgi:hypothetical protein
MQVLPYEMDDGIQFGEVEQAAPERALRPDENRHFAVVAYGDPQQGDLPIFVDLDVLADMEDHALSDTSVELGGVLLGGHYEDENGRPFVVVTDSLRARALRKHQGLVQVHARHLGGDHPRARRVSARVGHGRLVSHASRLGRVPVGHGHVHLRQFLQQAARCSVCDRSLPGRPGDVSVDGGLRGTGCEELADFSSQPPDFGLRNSNTM